MELQVDPETSIDNFFCRGILHSIQSEKITIVTNEGLKGILIFPNLLQVTKNLLSLYNARSDVEAFVIY